MSVLQKVFTKAHVALYRATDGRFGGTFGAGKVLLLTTTGKKTGLDRTVALMYFDDHGALFVSGSAAGAPRDPAWLNNLRANPIVKVQRGAEVTTMRAEPASPEKSAELWNRICGEFPRFRAYEQKTPRKFTMVYLREKG